MRYFNRLLATLLSLLLIVASVLLIIEVISDRFRHRPGVLHWHSSYDWAHRTSWMTGSVRTACIVAIVLGLVLLIAELKPARVSRLPVAADPGADVESEKGSDTAAPIDTAYTRSGVAAAVRSAATGVNGVRSASVKVKRRQVKVSATSAATDRAAADALREPVTEAIEHRLDDLRLQSRPSLSLNLAPRSR